MDRKRKAHDDPSELGARPPPIGLNIQTGPSDNTRSRTSHRAQNGFPGDDAMDGGGVDHPNGFDGDGGRRDDEMEGGGGMDRREDERREDGVERRDDGEGREDMREEEEELNGGGREMEEEEGDGMDGGMELDDPLISEVEGTRGEHSDSNLSVVSMGSPLRERNDEEKDEIRRRRRLRREQREGQRGQLPPLPNPDPAWRQQRAERQARLAREHDQLREVLRARNEEDEEHPPRGGAEGMEEENEDDEQPLLETTAIDESFLNFSINHDRPYGEHTDDEEGDGEGGGPFIQPQDGPEMDDGEGGGAPAAPANEDDAPGGGVQPLLNLPPLAQRPNINQAPAAADRNQEMQRGHIDNGDNQNEGREDGGGVQPPLLVPPHDHLRHLDPVVVQSLLRVIDGYSLANVHRGLPEFRRILKNLHTEYTGLPQPVQRVVLLNNNWVVQSTYVLTSPLTNGDCHLLQDDPPRNVNSVELFYGPRYVTSLIGMVDTSSAMAAVRFGLEVNGRPLPVSFPLAGLDVNIELIGYDFKIEILSSSIKEFLSNVFEALGEMRVEWSRNGCEATVFHEKVNRSRKIAILFNSCLLGGIEVRVVQDLNF